MTDAQTQTTGAMMHEYTKIQDAWEEMKKAGAVGANEEDPLRQIQDKQLFINGALSALTILDNGVDQQTLTEDIASQVEENGHAFLKAVRDRFGS